MRIVFIALLSFLPLSTFAASSEPAPDYSRDKCRVTASIAQKNDGYPGRQAIVSSNNLALPAGKATYAPGQQVHITGQVVDRNCVPVSDAIVEIWQVDTEGKKVKTTLGSRLNPYPAFAGSGRAITDNLGNFTFTTLFPGQESKNRTPYIHLRVARDGFKTLNTQMFFEGDNRNSTDPVLKKLIDGDRDTLMAKVNMSSNPEDGISVNWPIVLNGKNKYRKY